MKKKIFNKPVIYCVDDDLDILDIIAHKLKIVGYQVFTENSSRRAISSLLNSEIDPDLIILDIQMPHINGIEVYTALQEIKGLSMIPTIFLTSSESEEHKADAFALGATDYITKPTGLYDIENKIEKYLPPQTLWTPTPSKQSSPPDHESNKYSRLFEEDPVEKTKTNHQNKALSVYSKLDKFKRFLANQFNLTQTQWEHLINISDSKIYEYAMDVNISSDQIARSLALFFKIEYTSSINVHEFTYGILPQAFCEKNNVMPLSILDGKNRFIISNPFNMELVDALKRFKHYEFFITEPEKIKQVFLLKEDSHQETSNLEEEELDLNEIVQKMNFQNSSEDFENLDSDILATASEHEAPIIMLVNRLIEKAYKMDASDIHIEPQEKMLQIRYRIDGKLRVMNELTPAKQLSKTVANRIKIMSNLDISNARHPQDGRIVYKDFNLKKLDFNLRVSTAPMIYGEKITLRIIGKNRASLPLEQLGFSPHNLKTYLHNLNTPYGLILHVGPTGSGKSMSLYAALKEIQTPELNIQTIEDPVEYTLDGINQLQINKKSGLTFSNVLRAYLRQDPDVILLGEIRDIETAEICVEASLTGHLMFSTLHTNDAPSTIIRLLEMNIEPFMLTSTLTMICAQRLLRRLCEKCKIPYEPSQAERHQLGYKLSQQPLTIYRANGCEHCEYVGYKGRIGVHEIMVLNDDIKKVINHPKVTSEHLKKLAVKKMGMITLYWDSIYKVLNGITSIEEVINHVKPDEFNSLPVGWVKDNSMERTLVKNIA